MTTRLSDKLLFSDGHAIPLLVKEAAHAETSISGDEERKAS
jgi:hypothetical protein